MPLSSRHGPQLLPCWRMPAGSGSGGKCPRRRWRLNTSSSVSSRCPACSPVDHVVVVALERIEKFTQACVSEHSLGQYLYVFGIVISSFGVGVPVPILLFLRDNPPSFPSDANPPTTTTIVHRISMQNMAFRSVSVTNINERQLLFSCPAHRSRGALAPARGLKLLQYVPNSGKNRAYDWHQTTPVVYLCWRPLLNDTIHEDFGLTNDGWS